VSLTGDNFAAWHHKFGICLARNVMKIQKSSKNSYYKI